MFKFKYMYMLYFFITVIYKDIYLEVFKEINIIYILWTKGNIFKI